MVVSPFSRRFVALWWDVNFPAAIIAPSHPVQGCANEIVARRMAKKQRMRWNRWTVQPLLDVRVAVLSAC